MRAVFYQAAANLRSRKFQATLTLIMLTAAGTLLTVGLSAQGSARSAWERLFERTNGAHLWLELDPRVVNGEEADKLLRKLPEVDETTGSLRTIDSQALRLKGWIGDLEIREWPAGSVARPLLVAGRPPRPGSTEVVLDRNFAVENRLPLGRKVKVPSPRGAIEASVVGHALTAEICAYPLCSPAKTYLGVGALKTLGLDPAPLPQMERYNIGLRLRQPERVDQAFQAAQRALPPGAISRTTSWVRMASISEFSVAFRTLFLLSFSIVAALVSGLLMANAVGSAVRAEVRNTGILKAIGFTGAQLASVHLVENVSLGLASSIFSVPAGALVGSLTLRPIMALYGEGLVRPPPSALLLTPLFTLLVVTFFTALPLRRVAKAPTIESIRTGPEAPRGRRMRMRRLPVPLARAAADTLSRPVASAVTAMLLGASVLAGIYAQTINGFLTGLLTNPQVNLYAGGDVLAFRDGYPSDEDARRIIDAHPDVLAHRSEGTTTFQIPGERELLTARYVELPMVEFRLPVISGRMIQGSNEVLVGYGLARERNLVVGDDLTIDLKNHSLTLRVAGVYREFSNLGRQIYLSSQTARGSDPTSEPTLYVVKLRDGANPKAVADALQSATGEVMEARALAEQTLPSTFSQLPPVMWLLTALLGLMVAVGILSSVSSATQQRRREFGMLKAVGMTPPQVAASVTMGAVGLALVGFLVGLPAGIFGTRALMNSLSVSVGLGPLHFPIHLPRLVLILPVVVAIAAIGALIPAVRAGRAATVEVLRYE